MLALAASPFLPTFDEWQYPVTIGAEQQAWDNNSNMDFDALFLPKFPSAQAQDDENNHDHDVQRGESPQSASSVHDIGAALLAKKINHNASERDRRKKINGLYSTLRALLPATDHTKKLSIPATVGRVLKYIPELQKEVQDLIHKKEELLSKNSLLQGGSGKLISRKQKAAKKGKKIKEKSLSTSSISVNKLGDREIVVQISTNKRIALPEVLLLLEKDGLLVIDVSSFQCFGRAFYNIHLWTEATTIIKDEMLNGELLSLIEKHKPAGAFLDTTS